MLHFVCSGGCLTIQIEKGMCPVASCVRFRNPLSLCDCANGTHGDWLFRNHPDPEAARAAAKSKLAKLPEAFQALLATQSPPPPENSQPSEPILPKMAAKPKSAKKLKK